MATAEDKQIKQLPISPAEDLQGTDSTVIQRDGVGTDYQVPLQELGAYFRSVNSVQSYSGSGVPDNALGDNGDFYKQANGHVYLKAGGKWELLNNVPIPYPDFIPFNYDGTNNVVQLAFAPNTTGVAILNTLPLNPFKDYTIDGKNLIIKPELLTSGITYNLNILYFI
jgi:hypothetical protein